MKILVFSLIALLSSFASANEPKAKITLEPQSEHQSNKKNEIENQIYTLKSELKELEAMHLKFRSNIEKNLKLQQIIQESTTKLLDQTLLKDKEISSLSIRLFQPTNLYVFALPLVTVFIVLGGTFLSLRTIKIKSKESLDALEKSNMSQVKISEENNKAERLKSQESIISNSRQKWINALRDELASLISHLKQYSVASPDRNIEIFSKIWEEVFKIELMLNPNEELHKRLISEIDTAFSLCTNKDKSDEFSKQSSAVLSTAKEILKLEWQRVKFF